MIVMRMCTVPRIAGDWQIAGSIAIICGSLGDMFQAKKGALSEGHVSQLRVVWYSSGFRAQWEDE
eukprot:9791117-Lingulodinium_polyedra.AAC.1